MTFLFNVWNDFANVRRVLICLLSVLAFLLINNSSFGQCDTTTPSFTVDLSGNADSVWVSADTARKDYCCGASNPDRCIEFIITLDSLAQGIRFDFYSGAIPSGSLFYQIGCGTSYAVGADICLNGAGPHRLTFCKPGNNKNEYSITSIPAPQISPGTTVSMACVGEISVNGLVKDSITWTSVPYNATYNSFLNCTTGCDSVTVTPTGTFPDSINYSACGPIQGGCAGTSFCDTVTVYFVTDLAVQIQPENPTLCFGDTATTITAHGIGGLKPYKFYWSHIGGSGLGDSVQYVDTGTYIVSILDSLGCSLAYDTVIVTGYSDSIQALAGNDTFTCRSSGVIQMNGSVISATGGQWSGGTGTFSPSDTLLNATYTFSAGDLLAGNVLLRLVTRGNGTCPADTDYVSVFAENNPPGLLSGPDTVCQYEAGTHIASNSLGDSIAWQVNGGVIVGGNNYERVDVLWNTAGMGTITMYRTSLSFGCDTAVTDTVWVLPTPEPEITGPDSACEFETVNYTLPASATQTFSWVVNGGTIVSGQSTNSVNVFWNSYGVGTISVTVANSNGCDSTVTDNIVIIQKPTPQISGFDSSCHNKIYTYTVTDVVGNTYSWSATNGTLLSGQGTNSATILWGTIGTGIVNLTQTSAFGCDSAVSDTVVILYTPAPVITGDDSVCSNKITTYSVPSVAGDTYLWAVGNGTILSGQSTNSIDVLWGSVGVGTVSITQTSPAGCDSTVVDSITIFYTPAPVITGADSICENNTATYSVPAVVGDTYTWQVSNGTILSGQSTNSVDILWGTAGAGSVTITQTAPFGCDSTVVKNVTVIYTPKPVITGSDTACQNKQYTFSVPAVGGDTYAWQVSNGTITAGQGTNSIIAVFDTIGVGMVSITQTSALGCDSTITDTIVTVYTPAPVITGADSSCHNKIYTFSVPAVGGDAYSWAATNGSIIDGQGTNSITVAFDTVGTGTVSITQTSSFGCDSTLSTTVTILYTPVPVITGEDSTCHNNIYTYTTPSVVGDSYTWSVNNGTILTGQGTNNIDILWGTAGIGTVQVTQTSPSSCDSTVVDSIVILYTPAPVITGEDSACHNNIYTYTTPSVAGDSYTWLVNNGTIITGQNTNSIDILWGTAGIGTVQVTQTSPLGCDSTVVDSIVVLYTPVPIISGPDSTCHNKIYTYTTPNVAGDSYTWVVNNGTIITGQNTNSINILWGTAGIGTVQVTQTSPLGCDSTVVDSIVILYTPAPVITGEDSACHNNIYTYSTPNVVGDGYLWSVNNGSILSGQGTNSIDILWGTAGVGVVRLSQSSSLGCDSSVRDSIVILYTPAPVISGPDSTCHNNIYTYTTPSIVGDTYSWSVSNGTILTGQGTNSIDILWGTAGVGTVQVIQTSPLGCDSTVVDSIVVLYTPAPIISGLDSTCHNNIYTYTTPSIVGDTYSWSVSNGTILTGQGTNSIDILWGTVGSGTVSITQTSPLGCDSTVLDSIVILYTPAPIISGPDSTCYNNIYTYTTPVIGSDTYNWSVSNGTILTGQGTNSIDILWGTAGVGTVQVTQTSPLGCDSTVVDSIVILYTPAPIISGPDSTCHNNIYTYTTPAIGSDTYNWSVSNGTILTGQGTNSIDILWGTAGVGTVSITQTSPLGCDSTVSDSIVILYTPAPVISGPDSTCHNNIYTYTTPAIGSDTYNWSVSNGTILTGQGTNSVDILWGIAGVGTVQVTQTSPLGCDSTVSDSIVILYTPAPVLSSADTICHNKIYTHSVTNVIGDTYNWTVNSGTILSGQGTNSIDVLWGTVGSGTISVTQTSPLGCDSTVTDTLVVVYTPVPTLAGTDSTCHNKIYSYSVPAIAGDTYGWSVSNGTILTGQNTNTVDVLWGTVGAGTISVTQASPLGCDSTVSASITILYTPAPIISGADSTCQNKIYSYSISNVVGDSYNWTVTNGTIIAGQGTNSIDVMLDTVGSSVILVTQTSPLGCDSTVTDTINVIYTPAPILSGSDTVCHNNIYTYSVPNIVGDTYSWNVTNGAILTGQSTNSIDILWGTAGTGNVTVTQTSPFGCDSTLSASITILYTPAPIISGPDSTCHNYIYTYTTPSVVGDIYSWTVNNGTIITGQNTNSIDILWGTAGIGTVQVTQTSPLGCDSTVLDSIVILYTPAPVISGPDSTCHNNIYTYTTPSVAGDSYTWTVSNGTIVTGQGTNSIDILWGIAGVGTVSITQTSPLGCDSTVVDSIVILYTPAPVISGPDSTCHNNIYTYTTPSVVGDSYTWSVNNGTIVTGQGTNSIDILWGTAGVGTVSITQTSPLGCDSTVVDSIVILYTPAPIISGPDSTCHNNIYTYTTPAIGGDTYSWSVSNGTILTGQGTNSIDILWGTAGIGTVQVIQTSPLGCDSTVLDSIVILYTPAPIITGEDSACHNNIYTYTTPSVAGDGYTWTVSNGTIVTGQGTNSVDILWGTAGVGTAQVTQTSPLGCDSTVLDSIVILYTPAPVISGPDSTCQNKIYTYTTPSVVGDSYNWTITNGTIISGQGTNSIDVMQDTIGTSIVSITQTSPLGCDSTVSDTIVVVYTPTPVLSGTDTVCHNNIYTYSVPNIVGDTYSWSVSNGTILTGQSTNSVDVLWGTAGSGTVSVTQTSPFGCDSTLSATITILYTPAPVITGADSTCQNKIYTYTTPSVVGDSYTWTVTNGTIISGQGTNSIDVMLDTIGTSIVSITQTSPLGCDSIVSDTIVVVYTPAPVLAGADTVCHNKIYTYSVPNIVGDTYSWSVSNGTILTGQSTNSIDVLWGIAGSGSISITQTSPFGCDSTLSASITILYTPAPVITGEDSACHNNIYTYSTTSVAGDSYTWVVSNGTIISGQGTNSVDVLWGTAGAASISVTQTSPLSCDSTVSFPVLILYTPAPVISGADSACQNKIYTYTTPSVAGDSYNWTVSNGTIVTGQGTNSIDVMLDTVGSSVVLVTQTSPLGCDSTIIDTIHVIYTPAPVLSGADTVCHNNIYTYSVPNIVGDTFSWSVTNGTILTGQGTNSVDVLWGTAGSGTVSVTQTSPFGCDSTLNATITILYTPAPVISGEDSACHNNIYTYTTPSVAGDSYNWTVNNGSIITGQGTNSVDILWGTAGVGTVSITQTSPLGCDSTVVDSIVILYTPAPVITGADSACQNKIYTYTTASVAGDSYNWTVSNGTIIAGQSTNSIDVMLDTIGASVVSITQTSPLGCDSTITDTIHVIYTPAPIITGDDSVCHNNIYTYSVPNIVGDTFSWNATNGTILAGQGTNSIDILWGTAGAASVSVTQTSPLSCDSTITLPVLILYTPAPVITGADSACQNKIYTYSTPSVAGDSYNWTVTNGTIIAGQGTNSIDVMLDTVGTSVVLVTQTSPLGCDSTVTDTINVIYTPAPVLSGADTVCHNNIYTYSVPNIVGDTFNWSVSNGTIISGQGTNSVDVLWGTAGAASISVTQTSPLSCDSTITLPVLILYTPAPVITGADSACQNKIYTYSTPNVGGDSYNWTVTNGTIIAGQGTNSIDVMLDTVGTSVILVTQTSPLGCDSTITDTINVIYTPAPVLSGADTVCHNNIYTYSVPNIVGDTFSWSVTNGTILTGQGTNSVDVLWGTAGSGTVSVTQTSPYGCDSTLSATITILYTPAPVITGADSACQNKIYTYSTPSVAGDSYTWTVTNGTILTGQGTNSIDVMLDTVGNSVITITQILPLGCDSTVTDTIKVLYTPSPTISGLDTSCHNKIQTYSVPFVPTDTYSWAVSNGTIISGQGTNTVDVLWGTAGVMGSILATQTSPSGCDSTVGYNVVVVLYTPAPVITGTDSACHNKPYNYNVPSIAGDLYVWTVSNGTILSGQNTNAISVLWDTVGTGTISITQTSPLSCDSTITRTINVLYTPVPVVLGNDTACHNKIYTYSVPNIAGDSYTWTVTNGTILTGQSTTSVDVLWGTAGSGSISITQTSPLGCDSSITADITILYTPAPIITGADSACQNKIYTYTTSSVAGDSYNWTVSNGTIIAGQGTNSIDILWGTAGAASVSVTQTSPLSCDSAITLPVLILYTPAPVITGADSACQNKIYTYSTPNVGGDSYNWTVTNGTIIAGQGTNSIDVMLDTVGSSVVLVTQTSPLGCDSTITDTIRVIYTPAPVLSGADTVCHNNIYTYSVDSISGDVYSWSVTNGIILTGQGTSSVDVLWGTAGSGTVSVTQTSPFGCDSTLSATITILYTPVPIINGVDSACQNKIYTYTTPSVVGDSYTWTVTNGTIIAGQGTNSIDVMLDTVGTSVVLVTQTSPLGCDSTVTDTIRVIYTPAPVLTGADTVCHNNIYSYSVDSISGDTYNWSVTNGTILTGQGTSSIDVLWGVAGSGSVSVTQTSPYGCDSTLSATITILYTPAPVIAGGDSACQNKIYTYSTPSVAGDSYTWTVTNGTILTGQGTNSIDVMLDTIGSSVITITQSSPLGCDSTVSKTINVIYTPTPTISGPDTSCHNDIKTYAVPNVAGDTYNWSITNGTILSGQGTNTVDVLWGTAGVIGSILATQTSPFGCDSTVGYNVVVVLYTPAPVITGNDSVCDNNVYTYSTPAVAGDSYLWTVTGGTILTGDSTNSIDVVWNGVGTGSVTIYQASALGCDSTVTLPIRILYTPAPVITGADSACQNKIYTYSTPNVGGDSYNWVVTNGTIVTGQGTNSIDVMLDTVGTSVILVTQTSPLGCDSTVTDTINVLYTPAPVLTGADTVCHNNIYTYSVDSIVGDAFSWSVTNGSILTGQGTSSVDVLWGTAGSGTVSVTQTSPYGCDSTLSANITILYTPAPIITGADSACQNKIYTYSVPNIGGDNYTWTVSNGTIIAGQGTNSIDVMLDTIGSSVVLVTQTSPLGCDSTITDTINVIYTPAPVLSGADTVCHNNIYTYTVPAIVGDAYNWLVSNGNILTGQGTNSIDVLWGTAGSGTVSVTQTSQFGCDSTLSTTITILYTPAPVITGADSACQNKIYTYSTPSVAGDSYNWTVTNGTIIMGQGTSSIDVMLDTIGSSVVSLIQTSPLGCDSTVTKTINVIYTPAPTISGPDTSCHNDIKTYTVPNTPGDSYSWSVINGTIISGQGTNTVDVVWGTAGVTGSILATQTSPFGCDSTVGYNVVVVLYTPAPVITGNDSVCDNNVYTYSTPAIAGDSYTWTVVGGTILSGQNTNTIDVVWNGVGTGSIDIYQVSPLGCDSTVTLPIRILYTPTPVITGTDSACQNKIYTYTTPNIFADSYNWIVTNGTIIAGQGTNSIDVMLDTVGTSVVLVTQTSPLGCDSTVTDTINVIYTPAPVLTGADTVCHNNIYTYSVDSIVGDTFRWNVTNGTILTGQGTNSVDVIWGSAGSGTISITQASPLGCDSTLRANITILYTPAPIITGADSACQNKIYTYTTNNVAGDNYNWVVTNGTIIAGQGTNSIDVMLDTIGSSVVSIAQTSPLGCDSTVTDTIRVIYTPTPVITGPDTTCHNKIQTYSVPFVPGDGYTWNVTNGTIIGGQFNNTVNVLWGTAGVGNISLTQISPSGCDSTVAYNVVVILYTPAPVIAGNDSACHNKPYNYSVTAVAGDTYNWSINNGVIVTGQGTSAVTVLWDTVGTGVLTIQETSAAGCDSTISKTINILTTPNPLVVGSDTVCFNNIYPYSVTAVAGNTYSWSVTNGTILSGQNTTNISVLWGTAGIGTISVTQTTPLGCDSTVQDTITILYGPVPVLSGADSVCQNKTYTYSVPQKAGDTFSWTVTGGSIINGQGTNAINVLWGIPGVGNVSITQTSVMGCDSTLNLPVRILYTPAPVITGNDTVCNNKIYAYSTPAMFGDSYTWSVSGGTILSGQNTNSISVIWGTAGTGIVTLTEISALGCDTTVHDSVTILYSPNPQINGNDTVCFEQIHTYSVDSVGLDTYQWAVSNGIILSGQGTDTITVQWNTVGNGFVRVVQTSPLGCDSVMTLPVNIRYRPTPQLSGTTLVCSNKIIAYSTPNAVGDSYVWTAVNGTIINGQGTNTVDVMWNLTDTGYIYVDQISALGCDSVVFDTITIRPTPAPVLLGDDTVCHNKIGFYSVDSLPSHTYQWTITNGTLLSGQATSQISVIWGAAGTGRVTVTQTSDLGCDSSMFADIIIQSSPTPIISSPDTACHNKIYQHSVTTVPGNTYLWHVTNGTIVSDSTANIVSVEWGSVGKGYIQILQTNALGCDSLIKDSVVIVGSPAPLIAGPDTVCHNKITAYTVSPTQAGNTYSWSVINGTILSGQGTPTVSIQWGVAGTPASVSVLQTNQYGCDSVQIKNIQIDPTPAPVIQGNVNICSENFEYYTITPQPGHTYSWSVTGGALMSAIDSAGARVNWGAPGLGSVHITQTNQYGCDSSYTLPVTIRQGPVRLINGPDTVCETNPYNYAVTNPQPGDVYTWTTTGGTVQGANNAAQVTVIWNTVGIGNLRLDVTNSFGCDSVFDFAVDVFDLPVPDIRGDSVACSNTKNNLFKNYRYNTTQSANHTYSWSISGGGVITTGTNSDSVLIDWLAVGTYQVSLTITDQISGCVASQNFRVVVDSLSAPVINTSGVSGCSPMLVQFSEKLGSDDIAYQWLIDGIGFSAKKAPQKTYTAPGTYNARLIVSNAAGCIDTAVTQIIVRPSPVADFSISQNGEFVYEEDTAFFTNKSVNAVKYNWLFHDSTTDSSYNTSKYYTWPGTYTVLLAVENEYGCPDTVEKEVVVKVKPILFVPNAITPNGDLDNDYFEISTYFIIELKIIIFDRWGEIVFRSEDVNFKWDGTYKDYPVQQDVYGYYIIARGFNHEIITRTGNVTVIR